MAVCHTPIRLTAVVCMLLQVGVEMAPAAGNAMQLQACSSVSATAAEQLRLSVASVGNWRGALRSPIKSR